MPMTTTAGTPPQTGTPNRRRTSRSGGGRPAAPPLLAAIGLVGMEPLEPVLLAALIGGDPLLLIGPHGTGKSYALGRLCESLGLIWRHYNASLLNFDDLVGYPLPDAGGQLRYVPTPSAVWDAQAVFIDEISRCRPDMQNKLFPIIHERRVQGILLEKLVYRWAAMNPPQDGHADDVPGYAGSEPLDLALADRFAFVVEVPDWSTFSDDQQRQLIRLADVPVCEEAAASLRAHVAAGQALLPSVREAIAETIAGYIQTVASLLRRAEIRISGRRAATLLRNIAAVHTSRILVDSGADLQESALMGLHHGLPDAAAGRPLKRAKVIVCHREAWEACGKPDGGPLRQILFEPDPLKRLTVAIRFAGSIPAAEFSGIVSESVARLPDGARHAVLVELFESGAAGRLCAAVADDLARDYAVAATPRAIRVHAVRASAHFTFWQYLVDRLSTLPTSEADTPLLTNLLISLFDGIRIGTAQEVDTVIESWRQARLFMGATW